MRTQTVSIGLITLGLGLGTFVGVRHLRSQALLSSQRAPFTMRVQERTLLNDRGPSLYEKAYLFAVRSDGSTSQVYLGNDKDGKEIPISRTIRDLSARKKVVVSELARSMTTDYLSTDSVLLSKRHPTGPTCISDAPYLTQIGSGEYLGYHVVKLRNSGGTATTSIEHWAAPDLDCDYIYSKWYINNDDGSLHHTVEQAAVDIIPGEPAAELFAEPTDLAEKPPSGLVFDMVGPEASADDNLKSRLERMDRAYYDSRTAAR